MQQSKVLPLSQYPVTVRFSQNQTSGHDKHSPTELVATTLFVI